MRTIRVRERMRILGEPVMVADVKFPASQEIYWNIPCSVDGKIFERALVLEIRREADDVLTVPGSETNPVSAVTNLPPGFDGVEQMELLKALKKLTEEDIKECGFLTAIFSGAEYVGQGFLLERCAKAIGRSHERLFFGVGGEALDKSRWQTEAVDSCGFGLHMDSLDDEENFAKKERF